MFVIISYTAQHSTVQYSTVRYNPKICILKTKWTQAWWCLGECVMALVGDVPRVRITRLYIKIRMQIGAIRVEVGVREWEYRCVCTIHLLLLGENGGKEKETDPYPI